MPIVIKGLTEFTAAIKAIASDLNGTTIPEILAGAGEMLVQKAQQNAPVDTGYLRDHISITEKGADRVVVTSEADYSIYVEDGTSRMSAQPFMEPARSETESSINSIASTKIKATISKHWK